MSNGISVWISIISTSIPNSFNSETESIIKFKVDPYDTIDISLPLLRPQFYLIHNNIHLDL